MLSSCDGTLADLADNCVVATPEQCTQSGVFAGTPCLFRIVSASYLARNPGTLVGEVGGGGNGDSGDIETSPGLTIKHTCALVLASISLVLLSI